MISTYLKDKLNIQLFGAGTVYTPPATFYLALYTADPTPAGSGTEATGGSYTREVIDWHLVGVDYFNDAIITFDLPAGTFTHAGVKDASTSGNLLFYGAFVSPIVMASPGTSAIPVDTIRALLV